MKYRKVKFLDKILCWFGIHNWKYTSPKHDAKRYCKRCNLRQEPIYDMANGDTYYIDSIGHSEEDAQESIASA